MLFTDLKTQNSGTTSGCAVRHTASMPSSCSEQSELIPGPMCESIAYGSVMLDLGSVNAPPPLYTETLALAGQERNYVKKN